MAETLICNGKSQRFNSRATTVDFPDPDGPEIMTSCPRFIEVPISRGHLRANTNDCHGTNQLFNILNDFADLFDKRLDLDDTFGNRRIIGFRSDRVRFAKHFLNDKV